ncbi:MAG: ABC transporter substrate-binding protein [Clostridiales bacterium]|nr:ABC transporter substrate-binding protein [Clostridiales bacterium]MBR6484351.1 ABC transporter substrate-binding protein [Clostridiales bacterium]
MKRFFSILLLAAYVIFLAGCFRDGSAPETDTELFVIGFSQSGSESDWRLANTDSMIETFTEDKGYDLQMENAKQQQENQFAAVRSFILEGVDIIVIAPTMEEGWDTVLKEVYDAGIPVIIMDRSVNVWNDDLYLTNVGSDFLGQGNRAVEWLEGQTEGEELKILHLQGTYGTTAQLLRSQALEDGVSAHDNWELAGQICGDFTEAKGYEAMTEFLSENTDFNVLYSENDNMTFGAIRALDEAGITYGEGGQVRIITFDATSAALQLCFDGKVDLCVECNPLQGPSVEELIRQYRAGEDIPKQVYIEEALFTKDDLTQELIDGRTY